MPYVQRDFDGKIVGIFANAQPQEDGMLLTDPDPLPDDHPEVLAYLAEHPFPDFGPPPSREEWEKIHIAQEKIENEARRIQNLMVRHFQIWAELETALSLLLQEILNVQQPANNVARAIYFSLGGFDARITMVTKALEQYIFDHVGVEKKSKRELEHLGGIWEKLNAYMRAARKVRNEIAHGHVSSLPHGGKYHARLTSPVFDPIKQMNPLAKGSLPGLGVEDLKKALSRLSKLVGCIDRTNEVIQSFRRFGPKAFPKTIARLELNLQAVENLK